jgi:hypothetical protein
MFAGLRTVIYRVDGLEEAKTWYSKVPGAEPYFVFAGFNVGGYELGLDPDTSTGGANFSPPGQGQQSA